MFKKYQNGGIITSITNKSAISVYGSSRNEDNMKIKKSLKAKISLMTLLPLFAMVVIVDAFMFFRLAEYLDGGERASLMSVVIVFQVIIMAVAAVISLIMVGKMSDAITRIVKVLEKTAEGDLTVQMSAKDVMRMDEIVLNTTIL